MKKMLRYVAAVIAFCFLFLLCGKFFRYILVDDTSSYTRITFHEMYEQDNIDILLWDLPIAIERLYQKYWTRS